MEYTVDTSKGPVRFHSVGEPIVAIPQLYVLVKRDGTRSGPNSYSAISRLAGHLGGTIVKAES